jgi:hypothetical protein
MRAGTIPLLPMVAHALREWKLACPPSGQDLVFSARRGNPISLTHIVRQGWQPPSRPEWSTRRAAPSWRIDRHADGGLELPINGVQGRLGTPRSR